MSEKNKACPKCKLKLTIKLVSLTDDGKGMKVCRDCKRRIKRDNPDKDYRFSKSKGD